MMSETNSFVGSIEFTNDITLKIEKVLQRPILKRYYKGDVYHMCQAVIYEVNGKKMANIIIEDHMALGIDAGAFIKLTPRQATISSILKDLEKE